MNKELIILSFSFLIFGMIIVNMPNGTKITLEFNDSDLLPQKSCDIPPRNPNTNFSLAPEGCP